MITIKKDLVLYEHKGVFYTDCVKAVDACSADVEANGYTEYADVIRYEVTVNKVNFVEDDFGTYDEATDEGLFEIR
jgi:hypothetical protein